MSTIRSWDGDYSELNRVNGQREDSKEGDYLVGFSLSLLMDCQDHHPNGVGVGLWIGTLIHY